ncbi:MAG: hypothetical protein OEZ48_05815 [Candidatus Bathyarchaeota archaeon]|nr:hypothetical protein [Candidatus Bathyarchaeota archaeon]MDH5687356.1 hypothetical protein [Candidatus Bathyarchaeota archaeon]
MMHKLPRSVHVAVKAPKRKMLAAREDLADKISEIALRKGTLYDYLNETLEEAIRADSLGLSLKEAIEERGIVKVGRDSGFTFVPERLWFDICEKAYERLGVRWLTSLWYETGQWYGRYYGDLDKFKDAMNKLMWDLSEFEVSSKDRNLLVRCISPKFSESYSVLFGRFLEGALNALGYEFVDGDILKGVLNLRFKESKGG